MATNFPASLDALTNPVSTDSVATVDHAGQHANANDSIEALEAKVGANSSAVTTSHDYKLSEVTSTDKTVGKTATQTLTNKTLTSPVIATDITIPNTGLKVKDTDDSHSLIIKPGSNITANRTLTVTTGDSDRTIDLGSNLTIPADPNADRMLFWDDSAGAHAYLSAGAGLTITDTTINATGTTPTCVSAIALPLGQCQVANLTTNVNTTMTVALINIPAQITVNKLSFYADTVTVSGTAKCAVYSEDGATKLIDVTTATISAVGIVSTTVSAVTLTAGNYYVAIVPVGTTDIRSHSLSHTATNLLNSVSSEPVHTGTITVTAGTPPSTITPTTITGTANAPLFRFDN